ncbi:BadF/BadG/BcrA/BcrD ATPase family protein [Vibrio sp.]|uniref:BadF/BadG/BcrA/BcrD ATPase family protein n=1 Tax=Vibrio sp. TaxID=678 RepID=UPI003D11F11C
MSLYLVGVDGGGTSCRARIRHRDGQWLGEAKRGRANILLGVEQAMATVIETVRQAARNAGLADPALAQMDVGLALAGAEQRSAWQQMMAQQHPFHSVTLNTDAYGACLGAHRGDDGAIMIAGTGSCGLLISQGQQQMVGGREFPISDQGSGAMMGLRLIQQVILAYDDIAATTPLTSHVMHHFDQQIDHIVSWSKQALPRDYGQFSPAIFQFASEGDPLAIALLKQTAADIEMFLQALYQRGARRISLMGGIAERIQPWLSDSILPWIVPAQADAMEGALLFAGKPEHNLY